ncbi:SHOCT domain-containing protein [Streptomyces sp. cmx-4-7]|uniref:SHOCT domain-containing protein n=1 Tax=Streptomyces sp. cmx-4-7 TaxID=2790939 RepID=UPI0039808D50
MPGLLRGVARTAIISGTATAVSNRVSRRQAGRWAQQDYERAAAPRQAYGTPPPAPEPPAEESMDARISQLKELGRLKEQGVLSEDEFAAQKSRVLGA